MPEDRRHDHRLAIHAPSFFRERLEEALQGAPRIYGMGEGLPGRPARKRMLEYVLFGEETGPFHFTVSLLLEAGDPDERALQFARTVFDELAAMDDAARAIPSQYDENEELFEVEIDCDQRMVALRYSSTLWNTEWDVHFRWDASGGWTCLGIPDWREPGRYIT